MHDEMVAQVERMLDLHKQLAELDGELRRVVKMQIARLDERIDALVYSLYGLSQDEERVVKGR